MIRTANEIREDLISRFEARTNRQIREGSAIDLYNGAVALEMEKAFEEIENSKDPHIYTNLSGNNLDKFGAMVNIPRSTDEDDNTYLYRLMNWTHLKAASNETAINDSLLNLKYAVNAQYYPGIYGAGTGVVYVIPSSYETEEAVEAALKEARERVQPVIDPAAYIQYLAPTPRAVKFIIQIYSEVGDITTIKNTVDKEIASYVNAIPPKEYMSISEINRIGLGVDNVDYFNVIMTYIDKISYTNIRFLQEIDTKLLFDETIFEEITGE